MQKNNYLKPKHWQDLKNWEDIETVLLDMDGTLLDLYFDNYFWKKALPQAYHEKYQRHKKDNTHDNFQNLDTLYAEKSGTLDWYCLDFWEKKLGIDLMSLKRQYSHLIQFRPGVIDFLNFLVKRNITPVLVTNAHHNSLNLKLKSCPLNNWIEHMYSSHDFGLPKEDKAFWQTFSNAYRFDRNKTLFIDDNDAVLNSAKKFGIKHLYSIMQPDSKAQTTHNSDFLQIKHFHDLIPAEY